MKDEVRVLLVDDDVDFIENLKLLLTLKGKFDVVGTATSGGEALEVLKRTYADIAVIDLMMPGMSGLLLTRILNEKYPLMKKLVFTTFSDEKNIAEAIVNGADTYLVKGSPSKLIESINLLMMDQSIFDKKVVDWIRKNLAKTPSQDTIECDKLFQVLSETELAICEPLSEGYTNAQIAKALSFSEGTVKNAISSIFMKTGIDNRTKLASAMQKSLTVKLL